MSEDDLDEEGGEVPEGVAVFPEHERTPSDLWRAANNALLIAKRSSKNQVVFYQTVHAR